MTGASADKKADEIVGALAPSFDTIICTKAHHKGADAQTIAASVRKANPDARRRMSPPRSRTRSASAGRSPTSRNEKIYVAGGLFLAIEFATVARGGNARDLTFF